MVDKSRISQTEGSFQERDVGQNSEKVNKEGFGEFATDNTFTRILAKRSTNKRVLAMSDQATTAASLSDPDLLICPRHATDLSASPAPVSSVQRGALLLRAGSGCSTTSAHQMSAQSARCGGTPGWNQIRSRLAFWG